MQEYQTKITEKKYLTKHIVELVVELIHPQAIHFQAGQFMQFKIGGALKCYSMVCLPEEKNKILKFCVEILPQGQAADFFRNAQVGDQVSMLGPLGFFTLDDFSHNVTFVAAGVGVAPFCSIIPEALSRGHKAHLNLLFGLRHEEDIFYFDRFKALGALYHNFSFLPMLSRPKSHWPGQVGRVTTYLAAHYDKFKNNVFYVCGSLQAIKDVRQLLLDKGHNADYIKVEVF